MQHASTHDAGIWSRQSSFRFSAPVLMMSTSRTFPMDDRDVRGLFPYSVHVLFQSAWLLATWELPTFLSLELCLFVAQCGDGSTIYKIRSTPRAGFQKSVANDMYWRMVSVAHLIDAAMREEILPNDVRLARNRGANPLNWLLLSFQAFS